MSPPDANQRLFDIADAVVYLQSLGAKTASVNFVRGLISTGQVPHLRIGKKFFIGREALDRWIDQRQRKTK
jgi:hypothetical protein